MAGQEPSRDEPERFRIDSLDCSQVHFLDHMPFTRYCRSQYGGGRQHLRLGWEYKWRERFMRHTACRVGRHKMIRWWKSGTDVTWLACRNCMKGHSFD